MTASGRMIERGDLVWEPKDDARTTTVVGEFLDWLQQHRALYFADYNELWTWSVSDLEGFWTAVWDFFGVTAHEPYSEVLSSRDMLDARWFSGATLNYAEHALGDIRGGTDAHEIAVLGRSQTRPDLNLTWGQLRDQVARARCALSDLGVSSGDRVAGYVPNIPEALVAFLATVSLGAIWASCATEFGARSVVDRLEQIEPKVLFVVGGYMYGTKDVDRCDEVATVCQHLPSVEHVIDLQYGNYRVPDALSWPDLLAAADPSNVPPMTPVAFDHPLVVLFSSGTTGLPKAIVHGHGGILLEHLKNHGLSWDMRPGDRMLWFSTTAWMMWNALVSGLLMRSSIVMIDGNPMYPDVAWQWDLAEDVEATHMGASPGWVMASRRAGVELRNRELKIRIVGSAGAPLPPEGYAWIAEQLPQAQLNVGSGGTDVCSGLVQNNPLVPVWAGEISARCLGADVHAFDDAGEKVIGELGELVITSPMPSMPIGFWGDEDGQRYRSTYFDQYPGVWRHGDWIVFNENGSCHVAGRSDATLNRGGVRLGTAEFYRIVEELDGIADSLVVHLDDPDGGNGKLICFVTMDGPQLDEETIKRIRTALRDQLSPRHVPDAVVEIPIIPRNLTGKKLELPVKRILQGTPPEQVASPEALANPRSLNAIVEMIRRGDFASNGGQA